MTSEAPHATWVLIDTRARMPKVRALGLEVVRASGLSREHGIEVRVIDGVTVPITTPAKTVADCFRFRRHVGLEVAIDALKEYLRKRKGTVDALLAAARADRIYGVIKPYVEALV
jgi:predicted transcriptional regulator of viral defense system